MTHFNFALLQAAAGGQSMMPTVIMMVALFAILYFFMIRPQNKKQKEIQNFRNSLQVGQEIVTIGGICGTIRIINDTDNTVGVEVAKGVTMTFLKSAIMPKGSNAGQQ